MLLECIHNCYLRIIKNFIHIYNKINFPLRLFFLIYLFVFYYLFNYFNVVIIYYGLWPHTFINSQFIFKKNNL